MKREIKFYLLLIVSILIIIMLTDYQISLLKISDVSKNATITIVYAVVVSIVLVASIYIYNKKNFNETKAFRLVIPIIFILFFSTLPVLKSHDEDVHWYRIYDISQGNILAKTDKGNIFVEGSKTFPAAAFPYEVTKITDIQSEKTHDIKDLLSVEMGDIEIIVDISRTAVYAPIQYLPQAMGVYITRLFTAKPYIMVTVARFINMAVTFTILYFACAIMPYGKKVLLVLITIPIAVEVLTSLSPDGMTISMCFLFIAYVLNLLESKKQIQTKNMLILIFLSIIISLCKIVYLPLVGLVLLLPKTKFKSKKNQIYTISLIIGIATLINLVWLYISSRYLIDYQSGRAVQQLTALLEHPVEYIKIFMHTINLNMNTYIMSMYGNQLGLNEYISIHTVIPCVFFFMSMFIGITDKTIKNKFSKYQTIIISLIIVAVCILIFTSLYIQWTKNEDTSIMGIQGRYFIPIMPLAILLMGLLKIKSEYNEENILKGISIIILLTYINVIMVVFSNSI